MGEVNGLIGFSGFVGQHLMEQTNFQEIYRSTSVETLRNKCFDVLVCAGMPAVKWLANKEPERDKEILRSLIGILRSVTAKKFVLISTIDVYPDSSCGGDEDTDCHGQVNHAYGTHRRWFEDQIRELFQEHHVIRLPALYGDHMKKNYIFDLLHNREEFIQKINISSHFQWYDVADLWADVHMIMQNGIRFANLFTEPVMTKIIVQQCFPQHLDRIDISSAADLKYDLRTKHAHLWGKHDHYISTASEVLSKISQFVQCYVQPNPTPRLAISNIAWHEEVAENVFQLLELKSVKKLEIAPTKLFHSWEDILREQAVQAVKSQLQDREFEVISLQSILFGKPELELFGSEKVRVALLEHTKRVIDLASDFGAKIIVWGSPKQRLTHGKPYDECLQIAVSWFKTCGEYAKEKGVIIGFEANAKEYGCDFCYTTPQAAELVLSVNSPGFQLHLDTANLHMANDDISACVSMYQDIICHVQVSEPFLGPFHASKVEHKRMSQALAKIKYSGYISIEMRDNGSCLKDIAQAIQYVKKRYCMIAH